MKNKTEKTNCAVKNRRFFQKFIILPAIAMMMVFFIACGSEHEVTISDNPSYNSSNPSQTVNDNSTWNLLAITDPSWLDTAKRIQKIEWGEWTDVTAFYPNQATYQWLSGREGPSGYHKDAEQAHLSGAYAISDTISCGSCHYEGGLEQPWHGSTDLGMESGYEKPKTREIRVRAAYDEKRLYLHARWKSDTDASGRGLADSAAPVIAHQTYRYDGEGFASEALGRIAGPSEIEIDHVDQLKPGSRFNYEDRLAVMGVPASMNLTDPLGGSFNAHGCFIACHDDMRNMPHDLEKVQNHDFDSNPILGKDGMSESDLRHYILRSRDVDKDSNPREHFGTRFPAGDGTFETYLAEVVIPDVEKGNFIDLWQARTGRSVPMGRASADFIHPYRLHNNQYIDAEGWAETGVQNWFNNRPDPSYNNHMPWIYDARITGYWAINEDELAERMRNGHGPLITEGNDKNAVHLTSDDLFTWNPDKKDFQLNHDVTYNGEVIASKGDLLGASLLREGDLVPRRALQEAKGARATLKSFAGWNEGTYDIIFVRDRVVQLEDKKTTDHAFDPNSGHTIALSIFDDHASNRSHYVTFPMGLIGESAGRNVYRSHPNVDPDTPVILAKSNNHEPQQAVPTNAPDPETDRANLFEAGDFEDPSRCRGCHRDIYRAWFNSKHRFAWEDPFYQPDYLKASHETEGFTDVFCGECHAPIARRTGQLPPPDGSLFDETSTKGISCDYCHTVKEVVETVNVNTISEPGRVKRGPRGDGESRFHDVQFSEIHTDAAFCGACHNVVHPVTGAVVIDTYDDWKDGPYAEQGIRCQDCHMTPGAGVEKNPGKSATTGKERDHVATHFFQGASVFFQQREGNDEQAELAKQMLQAAASIETDATRNDNGLELLVRINNTGAGHKIPTGVTYIRKIWLEVTVKDDSDQVLYTSGHPIEGNHIDPDAVFYRLIFKDADGNLTPKSWVAHEIAYDRRIPAKGSDEQIFNIPLINATGGDYDVTVRLMYRSMSQAAANELGIENIEVPSIEMARAELKTK